MATIISGVTLNGVTVVDSGLPPPPAVYDLDAANYAAVPTTGSTVAGTGAFPVTVANAVAQWDGTTRKIWVNGTQLSSAGATGLNVTSSLLQVGATNIGGSEPLQGNIGQALIYNRALTSTEIQQNYNAVKSRYGL